MSSEIFVKAWLILFCIGLLSGCVSTPDRSSPFHFTSPQARNSQLALTGLMALDTAQTVTIARSPCLYEANPVAAEVFGSRRPSPERVLITNTLYITGHWLLGAYLDRKASAPIDLSISAEQDVRKRERWRGLRSLYYGLTGLGHGVAVARNQALGIRPLSSFDCGGAR